MKKFLIYAFLFIILIFIIANLFDIWGIIRNPSEYKRIYQLGNSTHLQFSSTGSYIIWRILQTIFLIPLLATLKNHIWNKPTIPLMNKTSMIIGTGFVVWNIYYYWFWYESGFDHYPGFDPYFF